MPSSGTLNTKILNADATTEDAERYLDLSYELSQTYLESMLGRPPYPNRSQGHRQDSPMRGIVVHYTANQYEEPTIRYFSSEDPHASTHFMIGALDNGLVLQLFSHRDRTWHAGSLFNHSHFGIDFANAGYLERDDEEQWVDYLGRDYTSVLPTFGGNPVAIDGWHSGRRFEVYPANQLAALHDASTHSIRAGEPGASSHVWTRPRRDRPTRGRILLKGRSGPGTSTHRATRTHLQRG